MFVEERQKEIGELLKERGKITVGEIVERYGISDESARRDLRQLEKQGVCRRTHGGAIYDGQVSVRPPVLRDYNAMPVYDNYREIAKAAAAMIRENDSIYLTGGSFGHIILPYLPTEFRYTVVVNSVELASALRPLGNAEIYAVGGKMRQSGSVTDSLAAEFVGGFRFDLCFLTGSGLTASLGLTNGTDETAAFQRRVIENSRKRVLLMPGVKVGTDSFLRVCDASVFDVVLTDRDCPEEERRALSEMGAEVMVVD